MVLRGKSENSEMKVKIQRLKAELKQSFTRSLKHCYDILLGFNTEASLLRRSYSACEKEEFKGGTRKKGASQKHQEQVANFYFPQMASIDPSKEASR